MDIKPDYLRSKPLNPKEKKINTNDKIFKAEIQIDFKNNTVNIIDKTDKEE